MKTNKPDKRPLDVRLRELLVDFDIEIVDAAVNGDDGLVRTFENVLADYRAAYPHNPSGSCGGGGPCPNGGRCHNCHEAGRLP